MANLVISGIVGWTLIDTHDGAVTFTAPTEEALVSGQYARMNTATGFQTLGNATTAAEIGTATSRRGIAINTVAINETTTFVNKGYLDLGNALDALAYGADVYLSDTDGTLADAQGTQLFIVGQVVPGFANTTPDKLLFVDLGA